ncbi:MAG TPA: CehA/McbA family metallohydrolase [Kofleriaceae bacterium]
MRTVLIAVLFAACSGGKRHAYSTTTFVPHVTDNGQAVAARVLLIGSDGVPLHVGTLDVYGKRQGQTACQIAPDAIASWDGLILAHGTADIPVGADKCAPTVAVPYGTYTVWAWRGIEYDLWKGTVDLSAGKGKVELAIPLTRAWTPKGALAADLHVHAHASNDSTVPNPQRVVAQVAAGIQVIGLSDHNRNGDLDEEITALGLQNVVASIASNEVTSEKLHVGVYPVPVDKTKPANGAMAEADVNKLSTQQLFDQLHALPTHPLVQVNHPRFRVSALFDGTGWNGTSWPPPFPTSFDAVEVLAGYTAFNAKGDRRFDEGVRDFYTFMNHGLLVAPLGNSDTHDLNWVLDGTARNYVYVPETVANFDESSFVNAIRAHRVVATTGPWLNVHASAAQGEADVGPGETLKATTVWLDIELAQASFVHAERIRITIGAAGGPQLVQQLDVPADQRTFHWAGTVAIGDVDTWIGVTADGDTAMPLEITGTYQRDRWQRPGVTPYAIIAPILVDVNGDGTWVAPQK